MVWGLDLREPLASTAEGYGHAEITSSGATVGTTQLVTMLVRTSRPVSLTVGRLRDEQSTGAVQRSLRAAWAARRIATGTLARVGPEPAGYDCVVCDVDDLSGAVGIRVVEIAPAELAQRYQRTHGRGGRRDRGGGGRDLRAAGGHGPDDRGLCPLAAFRGGARVTRRRAGHRRRRDQLPPAGAPLLARRRNRAVLRPRPRDDAREALGLRRRHADGRRAPDDQAARRGGALPRARDDRLRRRPARDREQRRARPRLGRPAATARAASERLVRLRPGLRRCARASARRPGRPRSSRSHPIRRRRAASATSSPKGSSASARSPSRERPTPRSAFAIEGASTASRPGLSPARTTTAARPPATWEIPSNGWRTTCASGASGCPERRKL